MSFQKTYTSPLRTRKHSYKDQILFSTIEEEKNITHQDLTIPIQDTPRETCKFCKMKQRLVSGPENYCLLHSVKRASRDIDEHLSDYLPTCKEITVSSFKPSSEQLSMASLLREARELYDRIYRVRMCVNTPSSLQREEVILELNRCIQLLRKECIKFSGHDNNTSYTISLQLDASRDISEWLKPCAELIYPYIEQEGLLPQLTSFTNSLHENSKSKDLFLNLMDNIESKFEYNHMMEEKYQVSLRKLNKKLLNYMEKAPPSNSFKEIEEDLNFVEQMSGLGEGVNKNISNSSIITKRKSFDDCNRENDLLKFVMLQAATIENILPEVMAGHSHSFGEY